MGIIYSETERGGGFPVNYHDLNAVSGYLRHYDNLLTLEFIAQKSRDAREKIQVNKEVEICRRKLAWWERHPNFELAAVTRGIEELKRKWEKAS